MAALFARSCAQGRDDRTLDLGRRGGNFRGRTATRVPPAVVTASASTSSLAPLAPVEVAPKEGVVWVSAAAGGGGGPGERRREGAECRCRRSGVGPVVEEYRLEDLPSVPGARSHQQQGGRVMAEGKRCVRPRRRSSPDGWVRMGQRKVLAHGWSRASANSVVSTPTELRLQPPNKACAAVRCVSIMETLMEVGGGDATQEEAKQVGGGEERRARESGRKGEVGREERKHSKRRHKERGTTPDWIRRVLEVARRGDVEELRRCLGGMDPTLVRNLSDHSGNNLLHMVAGRGHVGALAWLCGVGSDSAVSPSGGAAVPANGNLLEAALLDENRAGLTPIGVAIKNGRVGVVEWLLRQGEARLVPGSGTGVVSGSAATFSRRLWPGMPISVGPGVGEPSPLHLAAKYGQDRLVRWLLKRSGLQRRRPSPSPMLKSSHLDRTLNRSLDSGLNHGSGDWDEKNEDSAIWKDLLVHSPLHRDMERKFGQNWSGSSQEVEQKTERCIPGIINERDHRGRTPLHLAAKAGNMSTCRILLSHGADVSLKSELGRKASGCALSRGHNALSSWLSLWEAALTLASQLASATEVLAEAQKQNQELRGHFREVLMVGKRLAKERDEMCRELGEAVSARGSGPTSEHLLISRLHKAHFSGSLADMEHRLLLAEQWWRQANGKDRSTNTTNQIPSTTASATTPNEWKKAMQLLMCALVDAESGAGNVVRVEGVGELSSSSSSASRSSATSSSTASSPSRPSSRASAAPSSSEAEEEEERKLMALSLDAVYSEIEEREETRRRKSCDFGLLLGIGESTGAVQGIELRQRFHGLSLTSESGNASVLEVIEPPENEAGIVGPRYHSQSKPGGGQAVVVVGARRRGHRGGRVVEHSSPKECSTTSTVPWDVVLHRSVSETTINHGVPMEEEGGDEDRAKGLSVSVEDLLGGGGRVVQGTGECRREPSNVVQGRGGGNNASVSISGDAVGARSNQGGTSSAAVASCVPEGRTSTASHSSASSSSLSGNSRPDILAGTSPSQVMADELALSVACDVPDVGSESCGEAGVSSSSGINPISVGLLPISNSLSGLKKRNFLQKLSAKARWPSTKRKKTASPVGLSPSSHSLTSSPSSGSSSKRSQEISPEDFKETYLCPRIANGNVESSPSSCQESPRLSISNCPGEDCPDTSTKSLLTGTERDEDSNGHSLSSHTVLAVAPVSPLCDRHGSPGSSMGGHRASQVRAELASVAASEDSGIMMVAPPRPSSSASLPSSSSSCYYSAATRAVGAREASMVGGGGMVALEDKLHHGNGHHHRTLASYHLKCVGKRIGSAAEPFLTHPEKTLEAYLGRTRVQQQRQKGMEEMSLLHTPPPPRPPPSPLPDSPLSPSAVAHTSPILSERSTRLNLGEEPSTGVETVQMSKHRAGIQGLNCDTVDIRSQDVSSLASQTVDAVDIEDKTQVDMVDGCTEGVSPSHSQKCANGSEINGSVDRPWYDLSEEEEEEERVATEGGGGSSGLSGLSVVRSSSEEDEDMWKRECGKEANARRDTVLIDAVNEHEGKSAL